MKKIGINVFSHLSITNQQKGLQVTRQSISDIQSSPPLDVYNFETLVEYIANISYYNRQFCLFYRGQNNNYPQESNFTSLYPKIYRGNLNKVTLAKQFDILEKASKKMKGLLTEQKVALKIVGLNNLNKFKELTWAILQHYEIFPTPVLDITQSLRVAASFALLNKNGSIIDEGFLYVLGLPYINDNISFHVSDELFNIKLLSVCPPLAKRPFFQEGFGVGTFPHYEFETRDDKFDFNRRLIAKFKLVNTNKDFFGDGFNIIPFSSLFPNNHDAFYEMLQPLRDDPELKCLL